MIAGAIRTDMILSAEIMAIALGTVEAQPFAQQAVALFIVALGITVLVYGVVAIIVKADDFGVLLVRRYRGVAAWVGRALVAGMPTVLVLMGWVGMAAMIWVGGHIVIDGLNKLGVSRPHHLMHAAMAAVAAGGGAVVWLVEAGLAGLFGAALGAVLAAGLHALPRKAH